MKNTTVVWNIWKSERQIRFLILELTCWVLVQFVNVVVHILLTYRIVFCRWCLVHVYPSHPCPSEAVPSACEAIPSLCQSTARTWLLCWNNRWRRRATNQRSVQSAKINSDCNIIWKTLWAQFCWRKHRLEVLSTKPCPFLSKQQTVFLTLHSTNCCPLSFNCPVCSAWEVKGIWWIPFTCFQPNHWEADWTRLP